MDNPNEAPDKEKEKDKGEKEKDKGEKGEKGEMVEEGKGEGKGVESSKETKAEDGDMKHVKEDLEKAAKETREAIEELKKVKEEFVKARDEAEKAAKEAKEARAELEREREEKGEKEDKGEKGEVVVYTAAIGHADEFAAGGYIRHGHRVNLCKRLDDISDLGIAEIVTIQIALKSLYKMEGIKKKQIIIRADFSRILDPKRKVEDANFAREYGELKSLSKKFPNAVIFEHVKDPHEKARVKAENLARQALGIPSGSHHKGGSIDRSDGNRHRKKKKGERQINGEKNKGGSPHNQKRSPRRGRKGSNGSNGGTGSPD